MRSACVWFAREVYGDEEAEVRGDNEWRQVESHGRNLRIDLRGRGADSAGCDFGTLGSCSFDTNSTDEEAGEEEEVAENAHSAILQ